jgi:hypothetical protein
MKDICYWCGKEATSMEHVPPKCLFPEEKDINEILNKSYRDNLIRVPSCDEHNIRKSNLDEYLMVNLSGKVGNNLEGYVHTATKVARSRKRNPKLINVDKEEVLTVQNSEYPVLWVNVETEKLFYSFESIARALYFYEHDNIFSGTCFVVTELFNHPNDPEWTEFNIRSCQLIGHEKRFWKSEVKGSNPDIFTYQFSDIDNFKTTQTLALNFYGGICVYAILNSLNETELEKAKKLVAPAKKLFFGDLKSYNN